NLLLLSFLPNAQKCFSASFIQVIGSVLIRLKIIGSDNTAINATNHNPIHENTSKLFDHIESKTDSAWPIRVQKTNKRVEAD
ncbi:hypothetical protein RF400_18290, partial [Acinetobacter baumannii]|nr:hypothetical protein [Acinetobacter baumannii]